MKVRSIYKRVFSDDGTYLKQEQIPEDWKTSTRLRPLRSPNCYANCASCGRGFIDARGELLYPDFLVEPKDGSRLGICRDCFKALNQLKKFYGLEPEINTLNPSRFQLRSYDLDHDCWEAFSPPQNYQLVFKNEENKLRFGECATCPLCGRICLVNDFDFSRGNCVRHCDGEICGICVKCAMAFRSRAKELGHLPFAPKYPAGS